MHRWWKTFFFHADYSVASVKHMHSELKSIVGTISNEKYSLVMRSPVWWHTINVNSDVTSIVGSIFTKQYSVSVSFFLPVRTVDVSISIEQWLNRLFLKNIDFSSICRCSYKWHISISKQAIFLNEYLVKNVPYSSDPLWSPEMNTSSCNKLHCEINFYYHSFLFDVISNTVSSWINLLWRR